MRFYVRETFEYFIDADTEEEARRVQENVTVEGERVEFLASDVQDFGRYEE